MKHYDIITEFMSNPAVRLLKSADIIEIDKGIHEYSCPRCNWRNTVVSEFHEKKYHYCRSCGGKVENL